jgi:pimeloyl-ACP methyl ester carboxylesterase
MEDSTLKQTSIMIAAALVFSFSARSGATTPERHLLGTTFPPGFQVPIDASLGVPVIGFGSDVGPIAHTPVIFLHGNNDTPFPTACNPFGSIHHLAQYLLDNGYRPSELWGLGYQGDQCDLLSDQTKRSGPSHTTLANVPDLRAFVDSVLQYTGATHVDIVGHSLGVTVAREWMRQDNAYGVVRALVAVDGPNHGIINCSPSPLNYWQAPSLGGFTPNSAVCLEFGSDQTPFLATLNGAGEAPGPTRYLTILNVDTDFVFRPSQDGALPGVPAEDRDGAPHDFSESARLAGAPFVELVGQGQYDETLGTTHLGILNSPETWDAALEFLQDDDD